MHGGPRGGGGPPSSQGASYSLLRANPGCLICKVLNEDYRHKIIRFKTSRPSPSNFINSPKHAGSQTSGHAIQKKKELFGWKPFCIALVKNNTSWNIV